VTARLRAGAAVVLRSVSLGLAMASTSTVMYGRSTNSVTLPFSRPGFPRLRMLDCLGSWRAYCLFMQPPPTDLDMVVISHK
jgi:hypothetical protein